MVRPPRDPRLVWPVLLLVAAICWALSLFVTPLLAAGAPSRPVLAAAATVYLLGGAVCHQQPARSFHVRGVQLPVCARCTGLYVAAPAGVALALWGRRRRAMAPASRNGRLRLLLMASALPTFLLAVLEAAGLFHPSGAVRAVCALPLGMSIAWTIGSTVRGDLR